MFDALVSGNRSGRLGQGASVRVVAWRHDPDPAKLKAGAGLEDLNRFRTL